MPDSTKTRHDIIIRKLTQLKEMYDIDYSVGCPDGRNCVWEVYNGGIFTTGGMSTREVEFYLRGFEAGEHSERNKTVKQMRVMNGWKD